MCSSSINNSRKSNSSRNSSSMKIVQSLGQVLQIFLQVAKLLSSLAVVLQSTRSLGRKCLLARRPPTEAIWRRNGSRRLRKRCKTWQVASGSSGFERMPPLGVCSDWCGERRNTLTSPQISWSRRSVQRSTAHGSSGSRKANRRLSQKNVSAAAASGQRPVHFL